MNNLDPALKNTEYAIRKNLDEIKGSKAYKNVTLGYTVGRLERLLDNDVPEYLLVQDFLNGTAPFISDSIVNKSYNEVQSNLEKFPVTVKPEYIASESSTKQVTDEPIDAFVTDTLKVGSKSSNSETEADVFQNESSRPDTSDDKKVTEELMTLPERNLANKIFIAPVKPMFKEGDLDGDGFISSTEIERTLQEILEGRSSVTVSEFNEMVQYYTYYTSNADPIDFGGTEVVILDGVLTILKKEGEGVSEESRRILAKKYKEVDFDNDGDLTPDEVQKMINMFMEGDSTYSSERIYELIDLYFD
jgi:Ca2+-binding EF-hand superfamily protein